MIDRVTTNPEGHDIKVVHNQSDKLAKEEKLKKACAEFESIFINNLLKTMRASIPKSTFLHGGLDEDIYTSMFDQEVARKMASGRGIGIGEQIYKQFTKGAEKRFKEIPWSKDDKQQLSGVKLDGCEEKGRVAPSE